MAAENASAALPFLERLARGENRADRLLWLRIASDYFLNANVADQSRCGEFLTHFASCLTASTDAERLEVARKMLARASIPPALSRIFIDLGGEAAMFVLTHGRLPRETLFAALLAPKAARAVARREDLDHDLVTAIILSDDGEAIEALAGNPHAPLSGQQLRDLSNRAQRRVGEATGRRLADALLARTPPRAETAALFLEANPRQRSEILLAAQRLELGRGRFGAEPGARREAIEQLERAALEGETELFSSILAAMLGCPVELARRLAADRGGEPLAVTLAAIGAPNDVSVRILTAADLRDGSDYPRVGALARLRDALSPIAARAVVEAIVGRRILREGPWAEAGAGPLERRAYIGAPASIRDLAPVSRRRASTVGRAVEK